MKKNVGALLLGAAVLSLFVPKRRRKRSPHARIAESSADQAPNRLFALIQTRPTVCVLAISASVEELEHEIAELNETWNHWSLRCEQHSFEIQSALILTATNAAAQARRPEIARRS